MKYQSRSVRCAHERSDKVSLGCARNHVLGKRVHSARYDFESKYS
jgi:hypothetical protein